MPADFLQNNEPLLWVLGTLSLITFLSTLLIVPWLIVRIPNDYFAEKKRVPTSWREQHPVIRMLVLVAKNLLGAILFILGIAMLVLPGQGLLTILIGVMLLDFPGKFRFERGLIRLRPVLRSVNWLRKHRGRTPLTF